jgi:hypothetical protein
LRIGVTGMLERNPAWARFQPDASLSHHGGGVMDIAHRSHIGHGAHAWFGVGGMLLLLLLLIAGVLAMSTQPTQIASNDVPFDWSGAAPPVHPLIPHPSIP